MKTTEKPRVVPRRTRVLGGIVAAIVGLIDATMRLRIENEAAVRPLLRGEGGIFVTWHGRALAATRVLGGRGHWLLVSLSRDGDLLAEVLRRFGFRLIRGSSGRRGAGATREVLGVLRDGDVLAFTPDGPRGPNQKAQPGVAYFAQRSGRPIVPVGVGAWPCWRARSWDRCLVPLPFARTVWIYGTPITVGPGDDLEAATAEVEAAINALQAEAERRARRGAR